MPFENFAEEARQLETEIVRKGVVLDVDWEDESQVRELAREALAHRAADLAWPKEPAAQARLELFGLAQLMLTLMRESAEEGMFTHGGPAWKAFARALWREASARD